MSDSVAAVPHPPAHGHDAHEKHASVKTYIWIAVILGVITGIEIGVIYLPESIPLWVKYLIIVVTAVGKFALVVMFFMHLYYDAHLLTFLFVAGLVLAAMTLISLKALFYVPSLTPPEKPKPVALKPPNVEDGKKVFETNCAICHTAPGVKGASTCPDQAGIATRAGSRVSGQDAEAYIRESLDNPAAFMVPGYESAAPMPSFADSLSEQQKRDVIAFLMTLK